MRTWLKDLRIQKGYTQKHLSKLVGLSQNHYSSLENNIRRPSPETAIRIAKELGFDWKLFFEDNLSA